MAGYLYTIDEAERERAIASGCTDQGIACYVEPAGDPAITVPLYRLRNPDSNDHFYTLDQERRRDAVEGGGYLDEGVACNVWPNQVPDDRLHVFHELFNPQEGHHFYTAFDGEAEVAVIERGYVRQGITGYVFPGQPAGFELGLRPLFRLRLPKRDEPSSRPSAEEQSLVGEEQPPRPPGNRGKPRGRTAAKGKSRGRQPSAGTGDPPRREAEGGLNGK